MARKTSKPKVTDAVFEDVPETKIEATEITAESAADNMAAVTVDQELVTKRSEIKPIEPHAALATYPKEEQEKILALADQIDMRKFENVMNYGSAVFEKTFQEAGALIKKERGSHADQEVMKKVIELSQKASDTYEDFNLMLKEPNWFPKLLLKLSARKREERDVNLQKAAVSNFNLLTELRESSDTWMALLKDALQEISTAKMNDIHGTEVLQKYIIAGKLAQERAQEELKALEAKNVETGGLIQYSQEYEELKEGYDMFEVQMLNLENSRQLYMLAVAQLLITERTNKRVQMTVSTKTQKTLTLISMQIQNAILNEKNREVMEGQKQLSRLNEELVKEVSNSIGITARDAEEMLCSLPCSVETVKIAVTSLLDCYDQINKTIEEQIPKMKDDVAEMDALINTLEEKISSSSRKGADSIIATPTAKNSSSANNGDELTF